MKLVETVTTFKTKELIESMLDVAKVQGQRSVEMQGHLSWDFAVHVNLGRQCGHTTALGDILKDEPNHLLIVHNHCRVKHYDRNLYQPSHINVKSISTNECAMKGIVADTLVFESVRVEEAREFYNRYDYMIRPKAILLVGCY